MRFGLTPKDWAFLKDKLITPLKEKGAKVWVFGSRATGTHRKFSDIDILYECNFDLPASWLFQVKQELEDSQLPIKVDLVALQDVVESYKEQVLQTRKEV